MQHEEMKNERIDQLIVEYLSGSLTADAFQELKNWSQQSDENRMYVRNQIEVWFSSGVTAKDKVFDKEEVLPVSRNESERKSRRCTVSHGRPSTGWQP